MGNSTQVICNNPYGEKKSWGKKVNVCIGMTEPLCHKPETNTTL